MKPYQFYKVENTIDCNHNYSTTVRASLLHGSTREPQLKMKIIGKLEGTDFLKFNIEHEILKKKMGITTYELDGVFRDFRFNRFLSPEQFDAYYHKDKNIILFCASKDVCRSASKALNSLFNLSLTEMDFDFAKAAPLISSYGGAWFKGMSPEVQAAGLFGNDVQDDKTFKEFSKIGTISNVIIPYLFRGDTHQLMITKRSAVVLFEHYNNLESVELPLLLNIYNKIIEKTWNGS